MVDCCWWEGLVKLEVKVAVDGLITNRQASFIEIKGLEMKL